MRSEEIREMEEDLYLLGVQMDSRKTSEYLEDAIRR